MARWRPSLPATRRTSPPIVWSLLTSDTGVQNLGIFTDTNTDNQDDSLDDVAAADIADADDFNISQNGVLTFQNPPNFEVPVGSTNGNSNTYHIVVQASDGGVGSFVNWFKVTVTVTDMEEPGELAEWVVDANGDGTAQTPNKLLQFQPFAILTVINPTDSDGSVSNVRWQWYRSSSKSAMGTAIDGATSATYTVSDTSTSNDVGMYLRVMATYSDRRGPNKTASYVSENPVQAARDDNTVPEFALAEETRGIQENFTGNVGSPLTATDDDGDILTYSKAGTGADNANTSITINRATGQLMVGGLNFEAPADTGTDNIYVVTVKATDSKGGDSAFVEVTITVTDVNEMPMFTAGMEGMAADHPEDNEGEGLNISTYTATDPEDGEVTLSLTGDDEALFELNDTDPVVAGSKILAFKEMPDFEMPGDRNQDNVYEVTVQADDGELTADRMVTVKVTDADEMGEVELSSQDAMIGIELTAELTDSDSGAPDPAQFIDQVWTWHRLATAAAAAERTGQDANAIAGASSDKYTPVVADRGMYLKAMVSYTDRTRDEDNDGTNNDADGDFVGFMNMATSDATTAVRNNPDNQRPMFAEGASTVRLVEENTKALTGTADDDAAADNPADNVGGGPVVAMDADGDTVAYTLSGSDMFRVRGNGQIEVSDKAKLDYESRRAHTVTLTADDGTNEPNGTATITVNIQVTDLDEKPTISDRADSAAIGQQTVEYEENSTGPVIRLMARDPEGVTPIVWSLLEDAGGDQDLGIFTDTNTDGNDDSADDVAPADIADADNFEMSQNGELTFAASFEEDSEANNDMYRVVVQASDGGVVSHVNWFKVIVNVTDMEEDGAIAEWTVDPDGAGTDEDAGQSLLQFNASAILTVGALTDDDDGIVNVQWQWYRSSSKSARGTAIANTNENTYSVVDTPENPNDVGSYLRVEATYRDSRGPNKTASFVSVNPVQATRQSANTDPEFPLASVARRITEDTTGNVGAPVTATDGDGDIRTYSIPDNADNAFFAINRATGQLMVASGTTLNYEDPDDADTDNDYVVTVTATDSSGGSDTVTVTITVTDVNENPTFSAGTMGMADDHREDNNTLTISTYAATDPEGAEVTLSLMGDDEAMFELADDTEAGANVSQVLSFEKKPDFEMPGDQNRDNIYEVAVRASDGGLTADRMVTVKVTDADEMGEVELSSQDALIGVELMAELTDSDSGAPDPARFIDQVWTWHRLATAAAAAERTGQDANAIAGASSDKYTPVVADRGMYLKAMVSYTDRTRDEDNDGTNNDADGDFVGFMNMATSDATTAVRNNPDNQRPMFAEGASTVRLVEENTKALTGTADDDAAADNPADNVGGGPVIATDADAGDTLSYTLGGADAAMFRLRANGQIEVSDKADLDHESSDSHTVLITATDSSGRSNDSATITVNIHVTDLDERPEIMVGGLAISGDTSVSYEENGTGAVGGTYSAVGLDAAMATLTLEGDDDGDFTFQGGVLRFRSSPDYENPVDMDMDNTYMVTVKAHDGTYMAMLDVMVVVTNVNELGRVSGEATADYAENGAAAVATYTTDGPVSATWTLSGDDAGDFTINGGELTFAASPDYEGAADADTNNVYQVTVKADAGGEMGMVAVSVTVTDVDELGTVSLDSATPRVGTVLAATLDDPDGATGATWQWAKSGDMTAWDDIADATTDSYEPVEADEDHYLRVTVTYTDGEFGEETLMTTSGQVASADAVLAQFDSDDSGTIERSEVITAIRGYLAGTSDATRAEVIALIRRYLAGGN